MIRILLVEDHRLIVLGVKAAFSAADSSFELLGVVDDPNMVVTRYEDTEPDVVLMDVSFKGHERNGLDVIEELLAKHSDAKIVVFSHRNQELIIKRAFSAGALAYVLKYEDGEKILLRAIEEVAQGHKYISPGVKDLLANWSLSGRSVDKFSEEELEYFKLFATYITPDLVSDKKNVSVQYARRMRSTIKSRLNIEHDHELIEAARQAGLLPY